MEYGTKTFKNEVTGDFIGDLDLSPADAQFNKLIVQSRKQ